ncbi:MAG: DUF1353 domain-containing protein [Planctomycetota bacterium]
MKSPHLLATLSILLFAACQGPRGEPTRLQTSDVVLAEGGLDELVFDEEPGLESARRCKEKPHFGQFPDALDVEPVPGRRREDYLRSPFRFEDRKQGLVFTAPPYDAQRPWTWNGSSIPWVFRPVTGGPKTGCHALASVFHDWSYQRADDHGYRRKQCDRMYYNGVRANGVGRVQGKLMYYALRRFGGRNFKRSDGYVDDWSALADLPEEQQALHLVVVRRWIEAEDPDLEWLDEVDPGGEALSAFL